MTEQNMERDLDTVIVQALERRKEIAVPEDFAARVRASLPAKPVVKRRIGVGKSVAIVMAVLAAVVVFALAPHTTMSFTSFAFDLELVMMLQLFGIVYWLAAKEGIRS
jgi:hypothetical protein